MKKILFGIILMVIVLGSIAWNVGAVGIAPSQCNTNSLCTEITKIKNDLVSLKNKIQGLIFKDQQLQTKIDELGNKSTELRNKITILDNKVEDLVESSRLQNCIAVKVYSTYFLNSLSRGEPYLNRTPYTICEEKNRTCNHIQINNLKTLYYGSYCNQSRMVNNGSSIPIYEEKFSRIESCNEIAIQTYVFENTGCEPRVSQSNDSIAGLPDYNATLKWNIVEVSCC